MKIDLNWIKKELFAGREVELECVDSIGFLGAHHRNQSILKVGRLVVGSVDDAGVHLKDCFPGISPEELKYFRIKRPDPTFDDLIDVALTALKDRVLSGVELERDGVESLRYWTDKRSDCNVIFAQHNNYQDGIDFINSLYTETFVIESEDDIKMVKLKASVKLTNGNEFIVDNATSEFLTSSTSFEKLTILTLKGATVTQQKGNK